MIKKDELLLQLEELEDLFDHLEKQFTDIMQNEEEEIITRVYQSQLLLETRITRLEKKVRLKKRSASVAQNNLPFKLQQLG
ncbi:hypothetical protein ACQKP0_06985 [Heyndrickxia sp. NPDC080065]|uniref:hypothetical protein n=1 Tax=Heyndrickxia sp. NPDC080065 TaxID=3390568 RepID=UPI003D04B8F2